MRIGLIDGDRWNKPKDVYPNLVLMKLSAWHKRNGDTVEWYMPILGHFDIVYISKVFSFSEEYPYFIDADKVVRGGSGYAITIVGGKETFDKEKDTELPYEIEHIMPDYSLYGITDTAYGFMSRGCPRNCAFCVVGKKEGLCSTKVADLSEFWDGQKYIELYDPNTLACKDWKDILGQLAESKARVDFNQGLDIRLMTEEKAEAIMKVKTKLIHFAYDKIEDAKYIEPKLQMFREITGYNSDKVIVYVLCGFKEKRVLEEDLHRIYKIKENGFYPYVMLYDKAHIPKGSDLTRLQRWVNNKFVFKKCERFEDYKR